MKCKELATPVKRVSCLYSDMTLSQAIAKMQKCHYAMIPVIERNSMRYLYSVSTGDLLYHLVGKKELGDSLEAPLSTVRIDRLTPSCNEDVDVDEVYDMAINQNYVPLVDNSGIFRGILTRRALINYLISNSEGE